MARPSKLASVTIEQLKAELARRQNVLPKLLKKKAKLEKLVAALDAQIADLSGDAAVAEKVATKATKKAGKKAAAKKKGGRPPREGSLKAVMIAAMSGKKGMSVGEAMEAVQAAGYVSQSKNFRLLVNQTLLNEPEFKKVSRGVFTVKGQAAVAEEPVVAEKPVEKAAKKPAKKKIAKKKAKNTRKKN